MRITKTFSFDTVRDAELLEYIDGCRNASDSVRELLHKALHMQEQPSVKNKGSVYLGREGVLQPLLEQQIQIPIPMGEMRYEVVVTPFESGKKGRVDVQDVKEDSKVEILETNQSEQDDRINTALKAVNGKRETKESDVQRNAMYRIDGLDSVFAFLDGK